MLFRNLLVDYDTEEPMIFGHRFKYFGVSSKYESHTSHTIQFFIIWSRLLDSSLPGLYGWRFWLCSLQSSTQHICWRSPSELTQTFNSWLCPAEVKSPKKCLDPGFEWGGEDVRMGGIPSRNNLLMLMSIWIYDCRPVYDQVECDGWRLAGLWW